MLIFVTSKTNQSSTTMDKLLLTLALTATHYLFVYFTGNAPEKEQVCYAVSDDGFNYSPLNNGLPIIGSDTIARAKGVRDPHILRCDDGWFRMTVTDMRCRQGWDSNRGIVLLRSRDMVHWEHHTVHFPERFAGTPFAHVTRVWAPQTFFDQHTGRYLVYFSLLSSDGTIPYDRVYWCYANSDFTDLEGVPQVLFDFGAPAIDSDIVRDERGLLHLFFKTEADGAHKGIRQYVFKDIHQPSTWKLLDGFCETTKSDVEGAGVFPLINGGWCLMYDCYRDHYYQFTKSYTRNLKVFADWVRQQGGHIIFATPTARRLFNADHKTLAFTHGDYPEAMSTVARREQIPLIELNAMTRTFFTALGEEGSKQALVHYAANTFPDQSTPLADNTHFNPYGAWQVSRMVVMGLKQLQSPLADHLRPDFLPIDPSRPDSPSSFIWYMSGSSNILKPDGN